MANCLRCKEKITFINSYIVYDSETDETKKYCQKCADIIIKENVEKQRIKDKRNKEEKRKELEEIIVNAPKIKCPYCGQLFEKPTNEQYRDSAEKNVIKWVIAPAWGLAGSLKNKPFIECPHCGMKLMQG